MSNTIDRRIVEMQFDNKEFERNIQTSTKSLDALKEKLDFEDATKSLEAFEKVEKKFNLKAIEEAAESVKDKFSVLGTITDQVLRRMGDSIYNTLRQMKSFITDYTITPIKTGMQEYETQINSIQTILSNTRDKMVKEGKSDAERLDIVNDRLDQLNHYADKTIYNFTEMTRNIGTFTAAGVELDTAVNSIQGIANLAAVSGSTSEQASRAMYQLSQAISTGTVRLMDWNSVVNAGMGGEIFQKSLERTAKAMGKTVEVTEKVKKENGKYETKTVKKSVSALIKEKGFRESLSSGWLTADILTATLEQFSWDFEQAAKDILGNYEDEDSIIAMLAEKYLGSTDDIKTMDQAIARAKAALKDSEDFAMAAAKEIKKTELLSQGYTTEEAEDIIRLAIDATEAATKVKTFTQLFDTLKEAAQSGWTQSWEYIIGNFEEAKETLTGISDYFGKIIGDSADARNTVLQEWHDLGGRDTIWNKDPEKGPLGAFWNFVYGIMNIVNAIKEEFRKIFAPSTGETVYKLTQSIQTAAAKFKELTEESKEMETFRKVIGGIASVLGFIRDGVVGVFNALRNAFKTSSPEAEAICEEIINISDSVSEFTDNVKNSEFLTSFFSGLTEIFTVLKDAATSTFGSIYSWIKNLIGQVKSSGFFKNVGEEINSFVSWLPNAIKQVREWASSIAESIRQSEIFAKVSNAVKSVFNSIGNALGSFWRTLKNGVLKFFDVDTTGAKSVWDRMKIRVTAFGSAFVETFTNIKKKIPGAIDKLKEWTSGIFDSIKKSDAFYRVSFVVTKVFDIIKKTINKFLRNLKNGIVNFINADTSGAKNIWEGLKVRLSAFGDAFGEAFATIKEKAGEIWEKIKGFLSDLFTVKIPNFCSSIGVKMESIIGGVKSIDFAEIFKKVLGIVSLIELVRIVHNVSKIGNIANALRKMGRSMKLIAKYGMSVTKEGIVINGKKGEFRKNLLAIVGAIAALIAAIYILSKMNVKTLIRGSAMLAIIVGELWLISKVFSKTSLDGGGILKVAGALLLLLIPLNILARTKFVTLAKGMLAIGVILAELSIFTRMASKEFKFGKGEKAGFFGLALALGILAIAVKALGKMPTDQAIRGVAALGVIFLELSAFTKKNFLVDMKGMIGFAIAIGILTLCVDRLGKMKTGPLIKGVAALGGIMLALGQTMKLSKGAKMGKSLTLILSIAGIIGILVAAFKILKSGSGMDGLGTFAASFSGLILSLSVSLKLLSSIPITGSLKALGNLAILIVGLGTMLVGLGALQSVWSGMTPLLEKGGDVLGAIGRSIGKFVGGIREGLTGRAASTDRFLPQLGTDLSEFMTNSQGFIEGAKGIDSSTTEGAGNLASAILKITGTELISAITEWITGESSIVAFAKQLPVLGLGLSAYALSLIPLKMVSEDTINKSISLATALSDVATKITPSGPISWLMSKDTNLKSFGDQLKYLGAGLKNFVTEISGINSKNYDQSKIDAAVSVASSLAEMESGLEGQGGLEDAIEGVKSLSKFSEGFEPFAIGLNTFIQEAKNIEFNEKTDGNKVESIVSIAEKLSKLESSLEGQGGLDDAVEGVKSLKLFGEETPKFARGLNNFVAETLKLEYDEDAFETKFDAVMAVAKSLSSFEKQLEGQGGLGDFFLGKQDIGLFASNIEQFGAAIGSYLTSVGGIEVDEEGNAKVLGVADAIKSFIDNLEPEGGFWDEFASFFSGDKYTALKNYTSSMAMLGQDFATFSSGISGVTTGDIDYAKMLYDSVVKFMTDIDVSDYSRLDYKFEGAETLLEDMANFGLKMVDFSAGIKALASTHFSLNSAERLFEDFVIFYNATPEFDKGAPFNKYLDKIADFGETMWEFSNSAYSMGNVDVAKLNGASQMLSAFSEAFTATKGATTDDIDNMQTILDKFALVTIPDFSFEGLEAATAFIESLAGGIVSKDSIQTMATAVAMLSSECARLFVNNSSAVGQSVVNSAATMLRGTNGSLFDYIDPNPTIRPVLDLTNVQNGVRVLNGMLSGKSVSSVGMFRGNSLLGNVGALRMDGSKIGGTFSDKNIVSSIRNLESRIDNLGNSISNMKVVLNTGALVGSTSKFMDSALGALANIKNRGN